MTLREVTGEKDRFRTRASGSSLSGKYLRITNPQSDHSKLCEKEVQGGAARSGLRSASDAIGKGPGSNAYGTRPACERSAHTERRQARRRHLNASSCGGRKRKRSSGLPRALKGSSKYDAEQSASDGKRADQT